MKLKFVKEENAPTKTSTVVWYSHSLRQIPMYGPQVIRRQFVEIIALFAFLLERRRAFGRQEVERISIGHGHLITPAQLFDIPARGGLHHRHLLKKAKGALVNKFMIKSILKEEISEYINGMEFINNTRVMLNSLYSPVYLKLCIFEFQKLGRFIFVYENVTTIRVNTILCT